MQKIIKLAIKHPKSIIAALLLISVAAISQLGKLTVNVDDDGLMLAKDPDKAFYRLTQETFGPDNIITLFVEDKALFTAEKLKLLQAVSSQLAAIEGVARVNSLFTIKNFEHTGGKLEAKDFFASIPDTEAEIEQLRRAALRNPFTRNLLSPDGTAMAIQVYIRSGLSGSGIDSRLVNDVDKAAASLQKDAVFSVVDEITFERLFQIGPPYLRQLLGEAIIGDQVLLVILALGAVLVFFIFRLKSLNGLVVLLLTAAMSILWTLGLMGATGLPVTMLTAIVPVLVIVIGATQGIQMLERYVKGLAQSSDQHDAVLSVADWLGLAFFLALIAIYLGFLSIILTDIEMLQQFSMVMTVALLFNFIITAAVLPLYLRVFASEQSPEDTAAAKERSLFERATDALLLAISAKKMTVLVLAVILPLAIGSGAIRININNDPQSFLDRESPIHSRSEILAKQLHGMQTFTIVFSAGYDGAFKDPVLLNEIKKVQDFIEQIKIFDATLSLVDLVALLNREINDGSDEYFRIPAAPELNRYLTDTVSRSDIEPYVSADFRQAIVRVWHDLSASYELSRALNRLQEFTGTLDKRLDVRFTGADILVNAAANSLVAGQTKSLLGLIIVIFTIISVLFMSFKAGLIVLTPNLIAAVILFGLMGYLEIPLNIATVMVAAVTLGIAMTYTLHLMIRYNEEIREEASERIAMERTVRAEMKSIVQIAVGLALGFAVLLAASLKPVIYFGGLSAVMMLIALVVNLFVAPILLASMRFVTLWGMVTVNVRRDTIDNCPLFKEMHPWQIKQIILMSQVRDVQAGEMFIEQGAIGHEMYVILEGKVRVEKIAADGTAQILNHLQEGGVIGEIALVSQQERMANVVAETDLKLLILEWKTLERLRSFLPMISARLFLNIARIIGQRLNEIINSAKRG